MIDEGLVRVGGQVATKPASQVGTDAAVLVAEPHERRWVSRGAHKLLSALDVFEPEGLVVRGRRALDAGASTGGFTEVLLDKGVSEVIAVDVGYGQLAWSLREDERVEVRDRTNIRHLGPDDLGRRVDLIVSDLSFISLTVAMEALTRLCADDGDIVVMIKPQFEVGRERVGKKGVVRDPDLHVEAITQVVESAAARRWSTRLLAPSLLPGPAGNVEYFCWLRRDARAATAAMVAQVVAEGPARRSEP